MKRNDADVEDDLKRGLLSSPLRGGRGFTSELRNRIEQQVDVKCGYSRSWFAIIGFLCAFPFIIAAIASFSTFGEKSANTAASAQQPAVMSQQFEPDLFIDYPELPSFTSGLLIGLRTDDKETSYRTLYIAPRKDVPAVVAQGSGILVPYKRDFWKLEPLHYETVTDRYEFFVSVPADERTAVARTIGPSLFKDNTEEKVIHQEKILFAANEYVSIGETSDITIGNVSKENNRVWTTTIPNLAATRKPITLNEVLGVNYTAREFTTDQWFVSRNIGSWTAMSGGTETTAKNSVSLKEDYRKIDVQLPKSVVNHDDICCTWTDISTRFPNAKDIFSSPDKDMTVISTDGLLLVYGSPRQLAGEPALTVKLKAKETIVMAQWATGHYVQEWASKTAELLR